MSTKCIDAVYREGKIELLVSISLAEGTRVKVLIEEESHGEDAIDGRIDLVRRLRGAFRGSLSSSEEFSRRKAAEKALER